MITTNVGQAIASIIADSVNPDGQRITTFQLEYQRFIHAEFMTHRAFSRNASSSRAIPVQRMLEQVMDDPAMPDHWGANQAGMQAEAESEAPVQIPVALAEAFFQFAGDLPTHRCVDKQVAWRFSAWLAGSMSAEFSQAGYHKQVSNRLTEAYQTMKVVMTATENGLQNFYELRDHHMAQPEIQNLAKAMRMAHAESVPTLREWGEYHLPYVTGSEDPLTLTGKLMVSTAKCARVSYNRHDGESAGHTADFALHERLVGAHPRHFSPAEHPAAAVRGQYANYEGWMAYRWMLERDLTVGPSGMQLIASTPLARSRER